METFILKTLMPEHNYRLPDHFYDQLKMIEGQIIETLPDDFQKRIFHTFAKHKFNIVDILTSDWRTDIKENALRICDFLGQSPALEKSPLSDREIFLWLLEAAKENAIGDRYESIGTACKYAWESRTLLGRAFDEFQWHLFFDRIAVTFIGEFAPKTAVLIDIFCEVEGGEEFIRTMLDIPKDGEAV